ncbi:MAG TPA: PD-(D/E)XK nuclease family protein [Anaerolineales bacterium]|nr:PD-(D/E)XK nuclease family protein [Anaerolineales bacterium]
MPYTGFICEVTGERVTPDHCLSCARNGAPGCEIGSPAIIAGILRHQRPPDFALNAAQAARPDLDLRWGRSVTELLGCARKAWLMATEQWFEKPSKLYWAYRGTLFHSEAELYAGMDALAVSETRLMWFVKQAGKVVGLSGQPDLLLYDETLGGWKIIDYKTIKQVPGKIYRYTCTLANQIIYEMPFKVRGKQVNCPWCKTKHPVPSEDVTVEELPPQPRGSHTEQVQLYALLVEKNAAALAQKINGSNSLILSGAKPPIPENAPVVAAELMYLDMSTQKRLAVEIWPREQRIELLKARLAEHIRDEMPAILNNPPDLWQCDYCPVKAVCAMYHGGPVGKEMLVAEAAEAEALAEEVPA